MLALACLIVTACAGGGDDPPGASLLGFADPDAISVGYVDVAAVTADLGFGENPDPEELVRGTDTGLLWATHVVVGLPIFGSPRDVPLAVALDRTAIAEAIAAPPMVGLDRQATMVVRTEQPWEEIAARLGEFDYQDRGDGVFETTASRAEVLYTAVGTVDGVVIAGQDADVVAAAIAGGGDGPGPERLGELLAEAPGPMRIATFVGQDPARGCGFEYAAGSAVPTTGGEWVVYVGPDPEIDRVLVQADELWGRGGQFRTGEPQLDGDLLRVPLVGEPPIWRAKDGALGTGIALISATDSVLPAETSILAEYDCP